MKGIRKEMKKVKKKCVWREEIGREREKGETKRERERERK
jgi:hypothetical protein